MPPSLFILPTTDVKNPQSKSHPMSTYESRSNESTNHIFGTLVGINIPSMIIYLLSNATNFNFIYLRVADNERLRNHSFTLELEFAGIASEDPSRAIFRYSEKRLGWTTLTHTTTSGLRHSAALRNKTMVALSRAILLKSHGLTQCQSMSNSKALLTMSLQTLIRPAEHSL